MKIITLTVFSILMILSSNLFGQSKPIFDVHLHAHDAEDRIIRTLSRYVKPSLGLKQANTNEELFQRTLAQIEKHNLYCLTTGGDLAQDWKEKLPERIYTSLLFTHPNHFNLDSIRNEFEEGRWYALGEIVTQYFNVAPNDSILESTFSLAEELDIPVGIHIGMGPPGGNMRGETNFRASAGNPLQLEEVLISHPNLRIFIMHAGWPMLDEVVNLLYLYPQVYVDIALINWAIPKKEFHNYLERLVNAGFSNRIMFGSDQMVWPESIELAIDSVNSADFLTEKQKRDIFYNNAVRFFNFSKEEVMRHHNQK